MLPLLALLLTWQPPLTLCDGPPLLYPEQVTYTVPYRVRTMRVESFCPRDEFGQLQPCAVYLGANGWWSLAPVGHSDEWWAGAETSLLVDAQPDPPVGQVWDVQEPVAVNPARRSDQC